MLLAWPVEMAGTGRTGPGPGQSGVRMEDPGGCGRGGGGPWPCHTPSASPPSLCATRSEEERKGSKFSHLKLCSTLVSLPAAMN